MNPTGSTPAVTNQQPVKEFARMSSTAYQSLVKALPGPACPDTDLKAGFLLGIQFTLQKLREGFVIGE